MNLASRQDPRTIALELIERFRLEVENVEVLTQPRTRRGARVTPIDMARFVGVVGLARHVHELGQAIITLIDADQENQALPLLRLTLECSASAAWLSQAEGDDAVLAFARESIRTRKATAEEMKRSASSIFREGSAKVPDVDPSKVKESDDAGQARNFIQLCRDLKPGGEELYIFYRLLSSYSHAGATVTSFYWLGGESEPMAAYMEEEPSRAYDSQLILGILIPYMIWAGRAFSYLLPVAQRRPYGNYLRACARMVGTVDGLQLSDEYRSRKMRVKRP